MKIRVLIPLSVAAAGLLLTGAPFADDGQDVDGSSGATSRPPHQRFGGARGFGDAGAMSGRMLLHMADRLELTPEQQDSLRALLAEYQPRWRSLRERAGESRRSMMALSPDDADYAAVTLTVSQQAAELAAETVMLASDFQAQTYALLTEEQHQRLQELRSQRRDHFKSWRGEPKDGC
jgi:Spy/CpxP family protein refolding chaperone